MQREGEGEGGAASILVSRSQAVVPCTISMIFIDLSFLPWHPPCWLACGASAVFEKPKLLLWEEGGREGGGEGESNLFGIATDVARFCNQSEFEEDEAEGQEEDGGAE